MMKVLEVEGLVWQEEKVFVSYCPELDVSSCGDTVEEARTHLRTAIRLFVEEAQKMGTLETILQESGFKRTVQRRDGKSLG
jgi:predicted RNase H-like HicB family nuclease